LEHFADLSDPRQHRRGFVSGAGNAASGFGRDHRQGGRFVETTLWGTEPPGPSWRYPMTKVEVLDPGRDRANGYKVDVTCGERIGRHSTRRRLHSMRR
jgi:hypothetical protein